MSGQGSKNINGRKPLHGGKFADLAVQPLRKLTGKQAPNPDHEETHQRPPARPEDLMTEARMIARSVFH